MREVIAIVIATSIMLGISFTSCNKKKDWDCVCSWRLADSDTSVNYPLTELTKEQANVACSQDLFGAKGIESGGMPVSCSISR